MPPRAHLKRAADCLAPHALRGLLSQRAAQLRLARDCRALRRKPLHIRPRVLHGAREVLARVERDEGRDRLAVRVHEHAVGQRRHGRHERLVARVLHYRGRDATPRLRRLQRRRVLGRAARIRIHDRIRE